jgi:formyltetrahydrofolate deformylase
MYPTLLIDCPDQPGIVQAVTRFLYEAGVNIVRLDQHASEPVGGHYFMRLEFATANQSKTEAHMAEFQTKVAQHYAMRWQLYWPEPKPKVAVLCSKTSHTLLEILHLNSQGKLGGVVTKVISNHETLRELVESYNLPFHHVPIDKTSESKQASEAQILKLTEGDDLLVMARYMQILTDEFVSHWPLKIINIHHSFLPAFVGADPYRQAFDKGVKLIGATAHYATAELDQGPIIEQDVARFSHRESLSELRNLGQDVERAVLARAVRWHLERRIIVHHNKTIVFR